MGPGAQGKRSGTGALTELPEGMLEENMVLSNRDKSRHTDQRGLDSATVTIMSATSGSLTVETRRRTRAWTSRAGQRGACA
jgi:hypothetical protein